jgi:hypothetical protein
VAVKVLPLSLRLEVLAYNPSRAGVPLERFFFDESWFGKDLKTRTPLSEWEFHRDERVKDILFTPAE